MPKITILKKRGGFRFFHLINLLLRNLALGASLWIFYSKYYISHKAVLAPALPAKRKETPSVAAGNLSYYYEAGKGRPLVLVHSVNAAASAYEMRPLFLQYQGKRPLYALDLPGFGFSERRPGPYTPALFSEALGEFLEKVVKKPADVVALSLGAEFAAQVAVEKPELVHSLALISPAGMTAGGSASRRAGQAGASQKVHNLLAAPLWGQALFDLIATRPSIRFFLGRSFVGRVPAEMVEYAYATSHQPGAAAAPLYFISGALFTPQAVTELYQKVNVPGLVLYDEDGFTNFEGLPGLLEAQPCWQAVRIAPSKGLVHFEKLEETVKAMEDFWGGIK
jgi:pimeloyl-ACP methyl ester carboxylesterase